MKHKIGSMVLNMVFMRTFFRSEGIACVFKRHKAVVVPAIENNKIKDESNELAQSLQAKVYIVQNDVKIFKYFGNLKLGVVM